LTGTQDIEPFLGRFFAPSDFVSGWGNNVSNLLVTPFKGRLQRSPDFFLNKHQRESEPTNVGRLTGYA
jgi:hypothetical protein